MLLAEMSVRPFAPATHEIVIQGRSNDRADYRNQPTRPFLDELCTGLGSDALNDPRDQLIDNTFLQQVAPHVNSGSAGGSDPEFRRFRVRVVFEAVKQT